MERPYFPMFVDLTGKKVLTVGGGRIALRRVRTLLRFGAQICVIAPELCGELADLESEGRIRVERRRYRTGDTEGADLVLAAVDSREVNRAVWTECRERRIPVNVADDKSLCDFYFPSVVMTEDVVVGINSGGTDPGRVRKTRQWLARVHKEEDGEHSCT